MSIGKSDKKANQNSGHFLLCMLFAKKIRRFSSQLNIYKMDFLMYNITC